MSNIYIQEPPTNGKVLLKTTVGDIDVELWSKEAPLACRNFVQLCLEGYYDNTIFHRVVKGFIVQGGDPTGTGSGGESIYGDPFKDEIHSRLRFNRRGLVAMANAGTNDNGSQFFFTLGATPELQKKHTIFAKVAGKTIYNMIKLEEGDIDSDDRPAYPNKITGAEILNNPFPDIVPRIKTSKKSENDGVKKTVKAKAVKDFKLLSFGEEAEDDEEEIHEINKNFTGKTKHMPGLEESEEKLLSEGAKRKHDESESDDEELEHVKQIKVDSKPCGTEESSASIKKVRDKLNRLSKNISDHNEVSTSKLSWDENEKTPSPSKLRSNAMLDEYKKNQSEYGDIKKKLPPKGAKQTIDILAKFREKINKLRKTGDENETGKEESDDRDLLVHSLKCEDKLTLAKDANVKSDDWFEITDPRNTLNKRRRENSKFSKTQIKEELK